MATAGWRPLPAPRKGAEAFAVTPFGRLARAHAVAVAGDTLVAIALAGTLFFSIDVDQARGEVFLYLALTMAPFAVVAPLVGPALDRAAGGRRWMVIGSSGLRAFVCLLMVRDVDSLLLFPEAFVYLVLAKSYQVAKSALVPTVVRSHEGLVEANSKLSLISGVVGFAAAVPGALLLHFGGSEWVLGLAVIVFGVGVAISWRVPKVQVAAGPESAEGRAELRGAGVLLAASAMALLRGIVGFLTFLLAFSLRTDGSPTWHFGVVLAVSAVGSLTGAALAPALRRQTTEERIVAGCLIVVATLAVVGAWLGGLPGAAIVAVTVGVGAASAKQAFDSIVQRDAPDANRGRSFARFETRFQLVWVGGAVLGIIPMPMWVGFVLVAVISGFAGASYAAGSRGMHEVVQRRLHRRTPRTAASDATTVSPAVPPSIATPTPTPTRTRPPSDDPTIVEDP
jgi:Na+/melibiose symporter-like transporter